MKHSGPNWSGWHISRVARSVAFRARIVPECWRGLSNAAVAVKLRTTGFTVGFWRNRFIAEGLAGLGAPSAKIEQMVHLTLEKTPRGATDRSSSGLAARTGLSQSTISRIWRAFGLKPHRTENIQLSTYPRLIEKVRHIVGLYMNPPDGALCTVCGQKESNPGLKPQPADSAPASRATGAPHP